MFGLTSWPFLWSIIGVITTHGYWYPHPEFVASTFLYLPTTIELIGGRLRFLFTWIIIIGLVNTIWGVPTTPIVTIGNVVFRFKIFFVEIPLNSLPNFVVDPITTPLVTTYMLGATIVSTLVVVILVSSDWITLIPTCCFQVSTIAASDIIGGIVLIQNWWCSNLWLPIGILCGVECGCKYTFGFLLLVWIYG